MKSLSGTTAATEKDKTAYSLVFLCDLAMDAPGVPDATERYGARKYTVGAQSYEDLLISISDLRMAMRPGGGIAQVSDVTLGINNAGGESNFLDTYFLSNDEVDLYAIFVTGAEDTGDKIALFKGIVQDIDFDWETFTIRCADRSFQKYRKFPAETINFIDWPYVPFDNIQKPLPVPFGSLYNQPDNQTGDLRTALAPCICTNIYDQEYTSGRFLDSHSIPYVYYSAAKRYGRVVDYTQTGDFFTIDSNKRYVYLHPVRALATNDVSDHRLAWDLDSSTSATVGNGDNLDLQMGGCIKLGSVYSGSVLVWIFASGNYNYTVGGASGSAIGDKSVTLNHANYEDNWNFEELEVKIDGTVVTASTLAFVSATKKITDSANGLAVFKTGATIEVSGSTNNDGTYTIVTGGVAAEIVVSEALTDEGAGASVTIDTEAEIEEIRLRVQFYEQESMERAGQEVYQSCNGYKDVASQYHDGGLVATGGKLENPSHILEAIFRDRTWGMNRPVADINLSAFDDAATALSGWKFLFALTEKVDKPWIEEFCRQSKMRLFEDYAGETKVTVFDKTNACVGFFNNANIAVLNPDAPPPQQRSSFSLKKSQLSEIKNEIVLYYKRDPIGNYAGFKAATGLFRLSGTAGALVASTGKFTDATATFETDGVKADDVLVCETVNTGFTVDAVDSETQLSVSAITGSVPDRTGEDYWIGPTLNYDCWLSQQRHKTVNVLEIKSDLIHDDTTAGYLLDYLVEYFTIRPLLAEFATWFNAVHLELGDLVYLNHDRLPAGKRAAPTSSLASAMNDSQTTAVVATGEGSRFAADDMILIGSEVMKVTGVSTDTLTVTRAQANTVAVAHDSGATVSLLYVKWEVIELIPRANLGRQTPEPRIGLALRECPIDLSSGRHYDEDWFGGNYYY